ncbi:MAG: hypothetical protein IPP83_00120 [Flavobacteriales bacterium]|nr:hypothetical protein [Flavobacteriales bacterium]
MRGLSSVETYLLTNGFWAKPGRMNWRLDSA